MTTIPRSSYSVTEQGEFLCLVDSGHGRSITNDAEAVIADLAAAGHDLAARRVLYRDTMGYWDELVVKDGRFSHFAPIHETDLSRALIKARRGGTAHPAQLSADDLFAGDVPKDISDMHQENRPQERGGRGR
jgi:hypothetical protein